MKRVIVVLLTALLLPGVLAAGLSGTIYDENLDKATKVLVEIDTLPQQRMLSTDGSYSFAVSPGNYTITAQYPDGDSNKTTTENILITHEGNFVFDLFLFPELDEPILEEDEIFPDEDLLEPEPSKKPLDALTRFLIIAAIFIFGYIVWKKLPQKTDADPDDLGEQVLTFITKEGGRVTQKELRKQFPHSEAKISLVVSELESKGKIEKIKKGRSNILVRK